LFSFRNGDEVILIPERRVSTMKRRAKIVSGVLVVLGLGLALGGFSATAPNPPQDASQTIQIPAGRVCEFPVELLLTGKAKTIVLPGDRFIFTSPGLKVTLTNLDDPSKRVTLNITAPFHQETKQDGSVVTLSTGRSLLFDPEAGFVLAIGNFSFVFDAAGNLIQPLEGKGQLIDACALIE
jgi:hypothetical protein